MDIKKAKKPIHIQCPHCKKELQYNCTSIKSQKLGQLNRIEALSNKIKTETDKSKLKNLKIEKAKALFRLKLLNEDINMLSQLSEMEVLKIFKKNSKQYLGDELYIKLIKEAEKEYLEENSFNYYEIAIQKYTDYDKYIN